jgi:hypothetical protein
MQPLGQRLGVKGYSTGKCEGRLTIESSGGVFRFGLLVLSCLFGLGSQNFDRFTSVCLSGEGAIDRCHKRPTYKLPIASSMSFFGVQFKNGCWLDKPTSYCT